MTELVLEFEVENPELPLEMDRTGLSFFKASAKIIHQNGMKNFIQKRNL